MLPSSNISTTLVGTTIGLSTRNIRLLIVTAKVGGTNGLAFNPTDGKKYNNALPYGNIFSTYSPYEWYMPTDANGVCTGECYNRVRRKDQSKLEYRLGDWRNYNHIAKPPSITITKDSIYVNMSNSDGSGIGLVTLSLFTGDYDWRTSIDSEFDLLKIFYVIDIYRGTKKADGSILWVDNSYGQLKVPFDIVSDTDNTLKVETVSGGSTSTEYVFKAVVTMEYQYHPGTVNEVIRPITFTNHDMTIESNLVPINYNDPAPPLKVDNLECWYTDEFGDATSTTANIVSQTDYSGTWKRVTAIIEEQGADTFDWDTNPNIYMTVYDKNSNVRYSDVYCGSFGLRKVPVGETFTFNVDKPSSVTFQAYDQIYVDIRNI